MDMILAEVTDQDVENGMDNAVDFIGKIWSGIEAILAVTPDIVIGAVVFIAFCIWLIRKARHG
jgi:hypothetical protein